MLSGLDRNDPKEVSRIITACSRGSLSDGCLRTVFEANPSGCGDDICRSLSCKEKRGKEPDIADAVDYVLTFQEMQDIFDAAEISLEELPEEEKEHASKAGRLYARTGGVSQAVEEMVRQLSPDGKIGVRCEQANGTKECMEMMRRIQNKETDANFFEGMGCVGGCVGGPKAIIDSEKGKRYVDEYAKNSIYQTPLENPYVRKLLEELGFETVEELLEDNTLLTREF